MKNTPQRMPGWLPRRLRCLAAECDERSLYAGTGKFGRTYGAAYWALRQAADRIEQLERELRDAKDDRKQK